MNALPSRFWAVVPLFSAALLAGCGGSDDDGSSQAAPLACSDIASYKATSVDTVISTAEFVNASVASPWTSPNGGGGSATVTKPFCRVAGSIRPSAASDIRFELWLPPTGTWNEKFAGTASGGSAGYIAYGTVGAHFDMNYASIGHDNGHRVTEVDFALNNDRKVDFAYRAQHVVTLVGKEITRAHYAAAPKYAYYNGCSQSGHHGIMEMQRYPEDYDGIVAGAPASDWTGTLAAEANAALAQWGTVGAGIPRPLQLEVRNKVLELCDGQAGVDHLVDGVLDDPRRCNFDPVVMQCGAPGANPAACLSAPQVQALRVSLDGRYKTTGELVALGYTPDAIGNPFFPSNTTSPSAPQGSWANHWRYAVLGNPTYDFTTFNWDTDVDFARGKEGPTYDAISGDYSPFAERGGKFLMYHGWADSLITPALTIDEWNQMNARMGATKVSSFARLFMVPGMDHCAGGTGTSTFELVTALSNWVEKGIPPDSTNAANTPVASRAANAAAGLTARTRPLCPYPKIAKYNGIGSIDAASSFTCGAP
ncbi:MAG: tannase/feruloyl esterase family alpha/beta hydrolase, partial [Hyphomicrobium sp.]|nr:tannase/feruloyl esterase family alpha/beta hydrolase [Hyphomicrobium sp.]